MTTLKNKCTLVSIFDALAYQYPTILQKHDLDTPLDLVQLMLEGKASDWDNGDFLSNVKTIMVKNGSSPHSTVVWLYTCAYLKINMCARYAGAVDRVVDTLATINEKGPTLLNICDHGTNHVEFIPFPYVRNKVEQDLYEKYSANSHDQIKKFKEKDSIGEQSITLVDFISDDDFEDDLNKVFM